MSRFEEYVKSAKVKDISFSRLPIVISRTSPVSFAAEKMAAERTGCVLVVDPGSHVVGIFTERDMLMRVIGQGKPLTAAVETHMTAKPDTIGLQDTLLRAIQIMHEKHHRHLPVVDNGRPVAVLSARTLVRHFAELFPAQVFNLPPVHDQAYEEREGA